MNLRMESRKEWISAFTWMTKGMDSCLDWDKREVVIPVKAGSYKNKNYGDISTIKYCMGRFYVSTIFFSEKEWVG